MPLKIERFKYFMEDILNGTILRGRWSRGMIPRSHRGDQEFESPPAHLKKLFKGQFVFKRQFVFKNLGC